MTPSPGSKHVPSGFVAPHAAFSSRNSILAAIRFLLFSFFAFSAAISLRAQDLSPRAYVITPNHSNALILTYAYYSGNLLFDGTVPIKDAKATASTPIISYYHAFSFFGRSANVTASLPYGVGNFHGTVLGNETNVYRSGLFDSVYRLSVNLKGGPAMDIQEMRKWQQKTLIGVSLKVVAPTGQYDPTKLINWGNNRWGFKPEIGYSRRRGHWVLDAYAAAWFYTTNSDFFSRNQYFPGTRSRSENPIASFEGHLSYDIKPRLWISLDGNFWHGGEITTNGIVTPQSIQNSSRIGATVSIPITKHQSVKVSYNNGAYVNYGGDFQNISVGWQYSWLGRPK